MRRWVSKRRQWHQRHYVPRRVKRRLDRMEARGHFVRYRFPELGLRFPCRVLDLMPERPSTIPWHFKVEVESRSPTPLDRTCFDVMLLPRDALSRLQPCVSAGENHRPAER